MIVGLIEKQLNDLEYEYSDNDYFSDPIYDEKTNHEMTESELNDYMTEDYDVRERIDEITNIKNLIERKFEIRILNNNSNVVQRVYKFFVAERLNNICDIIHKYILNNIEKLYNDYLHEVNEDEISQIFTRTDHSREFIVIKKVLQYIVADCLGKNLTHFMDNNVTSFLNNNVEVLDGTSYYEILTSTVMISDIHHIINLTDKLRIKIHNDFDNMKKNI